MQGWLNLPTLCHFLLLGAFTAFHKALGDPGKISVPAQNLGEKLQVWEKWERQLSEVPRECELLLSGQWRREWGSLGNRVWMGTWHSGGQGVPATVAPSAQHPTGAPTTSCPPSTRSFTLVVAPRPRCPASWAPCLPATRFAGAKWSQGSSGKPRSSSPTDCMPGATGLWRAEPGCGGGIG